MIRTTDAGEASVALHYSTFRLSRAAHYAGVRRARGDAPPESDVMRLPRAPKFVALEVLLASIREALDRSGSQAWASAGSGRRCDERALASRANACTP